MRIRYDPEVDAMYVYIQGAPGEKVNHTQELEDGFAVDFRADGSVFGIEILDAKEVLGKGQLPKVVLENLSLILKT